MTLSRAQSAAVLNNLGWRTNTTGRYSWALKDFQRGWNLGAPLTIDGILGPKTTTALLMSEARRRVGLGTASAHFSFKEFTCKCGGHYANCRRVLILRAQVQSMEVYRGHSGPVLILSGYRCSEYNRSLGGASNSQHMYGTACDVRRKFSHNQVASWKVFAGIGYGKSTGQVCHVDRRDKSGSNTTGGTPLRPTTWVYNSY